MVVDGESMPWEGENYGERVSRATEVVQGKKERDWHSEDR